LYLSFPAPLQFPHEHTEKTFDAKHFFAPREKTGEREGNRHPLGGKRRKFRDCELELFWKPEKPAARQRGRTVRFGAFRHRD
jgi:hypothetical protein